VSSTARSRGKKETPRAHNNGIQIQPAGTLLPINELRRTSNMLSTALRFGTTKHFVPHAQQGVRWREGDHEANIAALAEREAELVVRDFPQFGEITIDPETLTVRDRDGRIVTDEEIDESIDK
jgi:hypothetical protein